MKAEWCGAESNAVSDSAWSPCIRHPDIRCPITILLFADSQLEFLPCTKWSGLIVVISARGVGQRVDAIISRNGPCRNFSLPYLPLVGIISPSREGRMAIFIESDLLWTCLLLLLLRPIGFVRYNIAMRWKLSASSGARFHLGTNEINFHVCLGMAV